MTKNQATKMLRHLADNPGGDPEHVHSAADAILLDYVPEDVRDAYQAVVDSCKWWAFA